MVKAFNYSCEGESHKATGKVCQDHSLTCSVEGLTMAVVCDGHGGERYFRSDIGSKFAAEATDLIADLAAKGCGITEVARVFSGEVEYSDINIDEALETFS